MYCPKCGKEVKNVGKFCEFCGEKIEIETEKYQNNSIYNEGGNREKEKSNIKLSKKQKMIVLSIVGIFILGFVGLKIFDYYTSAQAYAESYVKAMNNKKFGEIYKFFGDFLDEEAITEEMITNSLRDMDEKDKIPHMEIVKEGKRRDLILDERVRDEIELLDENKAFIPVEYYYEENDKTVQILTLYKNAKTGKWQIPFPYEIRAVKVKAPQGTTIVFDGKEIGNIEAEGNMIVKPVLEGKHTVEMKFYKDIAKPYKKEIYVPEESYVTSPYKNYTVDIATVSGAELTFDGNKIKENDGYIRLYHVLEGQHEINLKLDSEMAKPITKKLKVDNTNNYFKIKDFEAKEPFKEEIFSLVKNYNDAWSKSEKDKNIDHIKEFVTNRKYKDLKYNMQNADWKKCTYCEYTIEPLEVKIESEKFVYATVIENWHIKEETVEDGMTFRANGDKKLEYKLIVKWRYKIIKEDGTWKIDGNTKLEREAKYLDNTGKWIEK